MFVRTKKIKNHEYAYLVKNEWTKKGARQKVKKYLGRIIRPKRIKPNSYKIDPDKSFEDNIKSLITHELSNHNIQKPEKESNTKRQKIVIALNEGFLSEETIQQLLNLKTSPDKRPDKEGEKLATSLLEAGLSLTGEQFSKLFEIWQRDKQEQH